MNELMIKYTLIGDLKHSVFIVLHAGSMSPKINEMLDDLYHALSKDETDLFEKIRDNNEGV